MFTGDLLEDDGSRTDYEDNSMRYVFCTNVTLETDQDPERLQLLMIPISVEAENGTGTFTEASRDVCRVSIIDDDSKHFVSLCKTDLIHVKKFSFQVHTLSVQQSIELPPVLLLIT